MVQREVSAARTRPPAPEPQRTCVGCRVRASATGLLRVVVQGSLAVPDPRRRLPGRGAWVHPVEECVRLAERRRAFPRALRTGQLDTSAVSDHVGRTRSDPGERHGVTGTGTETTTRQAENS